MEKISAAEYQQLKAKPSAEKAEKKKNVTNTVQSKLKAGNRTYEIAESLLNAIWLKADAFVQVSDCGTHLEGQAKDGQWYRMDLQKIDKPSKS